MRKSDQALLGTQKRGTNNHEKILEKFYCRKFLQIIDL